MYDSSEEDAGCWMLGLEPLTMAFKKMFSAPEARWKLAGGEAQRNHRNSDAQWRVPAGTPELS
jgi:hypothetical protein